MNAIAMMQALGSASVETTLADEAAGRREGWVISGCGVDDSGLRRVELQKLDNPEPGEGTFKDDCDAWQHVAQQALTGSRLHLDALAAVDRVERALIAKNYRRK